MVNYNLNFAGAIIKASVLQYIWFNAKHIGYACTCSFHAMKIYNGYLRADHATYTCTCVIDKYLNSC